MSDSPFSDPECVFHECGRPRLRRDPPIRILAIASGGGHWVQLLRLRPALDGCCVVFASVQRANAIDIPGERFLVVPDANRWDRFRLAWMVVRVAWLVLRERPDVIISTGAAPGFAAIRIGKLIGCRAVWVDSIANIERLSMSGEMVGRHADLWLTQWPHLRRPDGPQCFGAML